MGAAMKAKNAIVIGGRHLGKNALMESSAIMCLEEAKAALARGEEDSAKTWAARSLAYTAGIFHKDYKRVRG